jgi:hypothetical protein
MQDRRGHCLATENRCNSRFLGLMPAVAVDDRWLRLE